MLNIPFVLVGRGRLYQSQNYTQSNITKNILLTNSLALMTDYKIEFPMPRFCYSWTGCGLGVVATIAAGDLINIIHPLTLQPLQQIITTIATNITTTTIIISPQNEGLLHPVWFPAWLLYCAVLEIAGFQKV